MEKSIENIESHFDFDVKMISPLSLAYIGDAVYELYIRSHIMQKGNMPVAKLHKTATRYVSAKAQASIVKAISDEFSKEEISVYKRGRNAHSYTSAKNADIIDYRMATGFEALVGYLYLKKDIQRLTYIVQISIKAIDKNI